MLKRDPLDCSAEGPEHENKQAKVRAQFASKWRPSNREDAQQFSTAASGLRGRVVLEEAEAEYGDLPISDDHKRALLEIRKRKTADLTDEHKENKKQRKKGQMRIVYFFLVKCNFFGLFVHFMWHIYTQCRF